MNTMLSSNMNNSKKKGNLILDLTSFKRTGEAERREEETEGSKKKRGGGGRNSKGLGDFNFRFQHRKLQF